MNMTYFFSQLLNGISMGAVYGLITLGFAMVYGILKLLNFAHSEIFMVGTFGSYFSMRWLLSIWPSHPILTLLASILIAGFVAGLLAIIIERVAYSPLRKEQKVVVLLTSIGVSILLQNICIKLFSAQTRGFPVIDLPNSRLISVIVLLACFSILEYIVFRSRFGEKVRAVAENATVSELMGINPRRIITQTFFLGGVFAGIAGIIWGINYGTVNPQMGFYPGLKAFILAVVGSIGNLRGAFLMGIALGLIETFFTAYLPGHISEYKNILSFILLLAILLYRPKGLLGNSAMEKV